MLATIHFYSRVVMRIAIAISIILLAAPAQSATGQEDDSSKPPRLVMKWKWGVGSATAGLFDQPWSVAVDGSGIIYVADTDNDRIQKFDAQGNLLLTWGSRGSEPDQFFSPQAVALDSQGNVLVSDTLNWRIQRFTPEGVYLSTITSPIGFYYHREMVVDSSGNLYVADASNGRIQKFDAEDNFLLSWNNSPCIYFTPAGMAMDGEGNLLVMNASCDLIEKYTQDGELLTSFHIIANSTSTSQLSGLAVDAAGRILAVDEYHHMVRIYNAQWDLLTTFGSYGSGAGQFNRPAGLALGPGGNIYIADAGNNRLQVFDPDGNFLWMIASDCLDCLSHPEGVAVNSAGKVYIADSGNNRVLVFDKNGHHQATIGSVGAAPGQFYFPNANDLEFDAQDHLYVADSWNDRIQKFDQQGSVEFIWQPAGGYEIALDGSGGVYLAEQQNQIVKLDRLGNFVLSWGGDGDQPGQFNIPRGIETDPDGNVWVGDGWNRRIQKFDAQGNFLLEWAPPNAAGDCFYADDFAIDPLGRVNILDVGRQRIIVLDTNGTYLTEWSLAELTGGEMGYAEGLAFDRWGNLYVTDYQKGQVFRFQLRPYHLDVTRLYEPGNGRSGVAQLSANAPGNTDPYSYTFVDGPGSEDNALFTIQGNQIIQSGDHTGDQLTYDIRVKVTNPWGDALEEPVTLVKGHFYFLPVVNP